MAWTDLFKRTGAILSATVNGPAPAAQSANGPRNAPPSGTAARTAPGSGNGAPVRSVPGATVVTRVSMPPPRPAPPARAQTPTRQQAAAAALPAVIDASMTDVVPCPLFLDRATGKSAAGGLVVALHATPGRSYVAGQRMLDVRTEIGVLPVRAKTNGFLVSFVVQPGAEVIEGKPLWRTRVSKPM